MKPRIQFYSDCPSFAGCENMLVVLLGDKELRLQYEISFTYRYSPAYEAGLVTRMPVAINISSLRMLDLPSQMERIRWRPLRTTARAVAFVLLVRYWCLLWNTAVLYRAWGKSDSKIDVLHINNGCYPGARSCISAVLAARLSDRICCQQPCSPVYLVSAIV